jgi:hypothetical protein
LGWQEEKRPGGSTLGRIGWRSNPAVDSVDPSGSAADRTRNLDHRNRRYSPGGEMNHLELSVDPVVGFERRKKDRRKTDRRRGDRRQGDRRQGGRENGNRLEWKGPEPARGPNRRQAVEGIDPRSAQALLTKEEKEQIYESCLQLARDLGRQ